jgi:hypothetical protein
MKKQLQQQKNSVTKIYPHVGKKNYDYFFDLIITRTRIRIKKYKNKKELGRWRYFLVTHLLGGGGDHLN